MKPKMIRVHENFKRMLDQTLREINKHTDNNLDMVTLTEILADKPNGSGLIALRFPIVVIPSQRKRGRPSKPLLERFVNINLEDEPR